MYNRIAGYKQYYKSLVMLGVPIIIGQLGAIITGLADTIMVGQHSTEELSIMHREWGMLQAHLSRKKFTPRL